MLALLLLFHYVAGKETQKDVPTIQHITSCPDIGYYFKRDVIPNAIDPGPCRLCFCQDNNTAVCWLRNNKRCDPKHYTFTGRKKREKRNRRSPGFSDVFFRDAAREIFNRQTPEECKPYESSYSEGCPPADWCIGCTVCDCDANGRWDCHTLSFCPDNKGKKQVKKRRHYQRNRVAKRQLPKKKPSPKTTKKPKQKPTRKSDKKPTIGKKPHIKQNKTKRNNNKANNNENTKKISQVKKSKKPYQKKKVPPKMKGSNKKVEKGKKPLTINSNRKNENFMDDHQTVQFTKMILKKVMASVNKIVNESQKSLNKGKIVQKRSMPKHINNKNKQNQSKTKSKKDKKIKQWQPVKGVPKRRSRRRRQVAQESVDNFEEENISKNLSKIDDIVFTSTNKYNIKILSDVKSKTNTSNIIKYYKYSIDYKYDNSTKEKNKTEKEYIKNENMLSKSIVLETTDANVTSADRTVFEFGHNNTRTTPIAILNNVHLQNNNLSKISLINKMILNKNSTCGQICKLKKALKMLIRSIGRENTTKKKDNAKKKNVMSDISKFFRRLFKSNDKKKISVVKKHVYRKRNIIKNLCKNITSCKFDPMDKNLQYKLDLLKIESNNILKSVRIIKGLLKLFGDRDVNIIKNTSTIDNSQQNKDILILNAIIKGRYNYARFTNLTETSLRQIDYIRDNTKMFIKSIESFALILNDILKTLRSDSKQRSPLRMLRCIKKHQNDSLKNGTVGEKIEKLKKLLINYNLIQNRFMKNMFDVIGTLDKKTKPETIKLAKVSDETAKYNESLVIENYTKNIMKNLRKLKGLAEKLSFNNRIKRAAMAEDDAIDYFLRLIEYLLQKDNPLDVPPVSDGIDLLIEAIRNSPAIKPIQKNILDSVPLRTFKPDKITESPLVPPRLKANKVIKVFESIDKDFVGTNRYDYSDKFHQKPDKNEDLDDKSTTSNIDLTTSIPNVYIAKENEKINVILDKFGNGKNNDKIGYEVFVDDTDEDEGIITTSTPVTEVTEVDTEVDLSVTQNIPKRSTEPPNVQKNHLNNSLNTLTVSKKTKLDWIEENFRRGEDRREVLEKNETTTQSARVTATRTIKTASVKYYYPISSISRETEDERHGKTMNPEYLMYKKQINLLNSLDYGTEKTVLDSDSKEEKYNSESFPFM